MIGLASSFESFESVIISKLYFRLISYFDEKAFVSHRHCAGCILHEGWKIQIDRINQVSLLHIEIFFEPFNHLSYAAPMNFAFSFLFWKKKNNNEIFFCPSIIFNYILHGCQPTHQKHSPAVFIQSSIHMVYVAVAVPVYTLTIHSRGILHSRSHGKYMLRIYIYMWKRNIMTNWNDSSSSNAMQFFWLVHWDFWLTKR